VRGLLLAPLLLTLTSCVAVNANVATSSCAAGETRQEVAQLSFGRNIGQEVGVSQAEFTRFLDEEVTPRFPDGLSVFDGEGRWLHRGVLYKEPGKLLVLFLTKPGDRAKLSEIAAAYERRYKQDSVLIRVHPECIQFHYAKP